MKKNKITIDEDYKVWINSVKERIHSIQAKIAVEINHSLITFYWELGKEIVSKESTRRWGDGFLKQLSKDLISEFPDIKGFSKRNLEYIRRWYKFWHKDNLINSQIVAQLKKIPWWHNVLIISKCKTINEALFYLDQTIQNRWSKKVLLHQLDTQLYKRENRTISNFSKVLTKDQSEIAQQTLKDPYIFDFLSLGTQYNERELEKGLIEHITSFLLELGAGFAYMGKQVPLKVSSKDFFIDLLFYHTSLHCYVVIELKTTDFEPEFAGKLNFYIKAVDELIKKEDDEKTIGLLICKSKDQLVVEYSLHNIDNPIGVSEYKLTQYLPETLSNCLPSVADIEAEFNKL